MYELVFRDGPMGGGGEDRVLVTAPTPGLVPCDYWFMPAPVRPQEAVLVEGEECPDCGWTGAHAWTCLHAKDLPRPDLRWVLVGNSLLGAPEQPWPGQVHYKLEAVEGQRAYYAAAAV